MKNFFATIFLILFCVNAFANSDFTIGKWYTAFNDEAWHCSVRFGENKTVEFSEGIDYPFGHDFWDKTYKYTAKDYGIGEKITFKTYLGFDWLEEKILGEAK